MKNRVLDWRGKVEHHVPSRPLFGTCETRLSLMERGLLKPVDYAERVRNLHSRGFHVAAEALLADMHANGMMG